MPVCVPTGTPAGLIVAMKLDGAVPLRVLIESQLPPLLVVAAAVKAREAAFVKTDSNCSVISVAPSRARTEVAGMVK